MVVRGKLDAEVLIVEDMASIVQTYKTCLKGDVSRVSSATSVRDAKCKIEAHRPDVVILDINLPDGTGLDVLKFLKTENLACEAIVITGNGSINLAIEAMREGAFDFIVKPISPERLQCTVREAVQRRALRVSETSDDQAASQGKILDLLGESDAMKSVIADLHRVASSKATVFLHGESGTGKEVCARAVHDLSPRAGGPFVALNCAAIPKDLLESELFGHKRGAFTGATDDRKGAALLADGGTLFLDEIGEMNLDFQAKMLRFLETYQVQRVGDSVPVATDLRIVCATNRDLSKEVARGRFREDLYYRLHVIPVMLPALKERGDDVLLIAREFLKTFAEEEGKSFLGFSPAAEQAMLGYDWPGNIRELKNTIRRIAVMAEGGHVDAEMLGIDGANGQMGRRDHHHEPAQAGASLPIADGDSGPTILPLEQQIEAAINEAIRLCDGSIPEAARALKVSPSTIYRRLHANPARNKKASAA